MDIAEKETPAVKNCLTCHWWDNKNGKPGLCQNSNWKNGKPSNPEEPVCGSGFQNKRPTSWICAIAAKAAIQKQEQEERQAQ
jgi:hypothetical protein